MHAFLQEEELLRFSLDEPAPAMQLPVAPVNPMAAFDPFGAAPSAPQGNPFADDAFGTAPASNPFHMPPPPAPAPAQAAPAQVETIFF